MITQFVRRILDRRRKAEPIKTERRRGNMKEATQKFIDATERLRESIDRHTDIKRFVANDRQQVVTFSTYREICPAKGAEIGGVRLCRHPQHPDAANSEMRICDEDKCPRLDMALKGVA